MRTVNKLGAQSRQQDRTERTTGDNGDEMTTTDRPAAIAADIPALWTAEAPMTPVLLFALLAFVGCKADSSGPSHVEYKCEAVDCPTASSTIEARGVTTVVECVWSCEEHESYTRLVWERGGGCFRVVDVVVEDCG